MSKPVQQQAQSDKIRFRLHPRVFAALGSELVTNDVVAIIELVKNSYDAQATRVEVRLVGDNGNLRIEVEDDGMGMSRSVIEDVWCVVATPYRLDAPFSHNGQKARRVSGEKGLGRLSAARLGERLEMITKSTDEPCWQVNVKWADLAKADNLDSCNVGIRECESTRLSGHTGTLVRILNLKSEWDESRMKELREQLSRLVSPFVEIKDFEIWLTLPGEEAEPLEIKAPGFLSSPPYLLKGHVDKFGIVKCNYRYSAQQGSRTVPIKRELQASDGDSEQPDNENDKTPCGPFDFEIRAWDIDSTSVQELAQRFELNKATIRKDIKSHQGISLYRDGILVLPKSDSARDWLGLDLRRVSRTGTRLSTSQIVGYVAITAEHNSEIKDTSDRERLEDNPASKFFKRLLQDVVKILEDERSKDRQETKKEQPFKDLFASLSTKPLLERMSEALKQGAEASELLPLVEEYGAELEKTVGQIEQRLVYYSRLASLGVLAAMLVHEVRNHTFVIGRLTRAVRELTDRGDPSAVTIEEDLKLAEQGIRSLERLAERFSPLSSRAFRTRRRDSHLEELIRDCLGMREGDIKAKKVVAECDSSSKTTVAVDPGELTAVILNLLDNSLHWLSYVKDRPRRIEFHISPRPKTSRVYVRVDDSGPGIQDDDEERIFWPGVTRKNEGLGMGLTVASEIVAQYGGRLHLIKPGMLGGASFGFDLPLSERAK